MNIRYYFLFLLCGGLFGCVTTPKTYQSGKTLGQWESKVQVRNFERDEIHQGSLDFIAQKPNRFRLEATGPLGIRIASFVQDGDYVAFVNYTEKKVFEGSSLQGSLQKVIGLPVKPTFLMHVFFDEDPQESGWVCKKSGEYLDSCINAQKKMSVRWSERDGEKKRITLRDEKVELQILVKSFTSKVQVNDKTFSLKETIERYKRN